MPKLKPGTIVPTNAEDAVITAAANSDPDNPPLSDETMAQWGTVGGLPTQGKDQEVVSIGLDADLLATLRHEQGWKARINAILRREVLGEA